MKKIIALAALVTALSLTACVSADKPAVAAQDTTKTAVDSVAPVAAPTVK